MAHVQYARQPMAHMQMSMTGGNKNALNIPMDASGQRSWSYGLCGCDGACFLSCCCPCMQYAKNRSRLESLETRGTPGSGNCCTGWCCLYACLGPFAWIIQMGLRGNIRARYRISGGGCGDCCAAYCCAPCDLTQGSREIELEEKSMRRA